MSTAAQIANFYRRDQVLKQDDQQSGAGASPQPSSAQQQQDSSNSRRRRAATTAVRSGATTTASSGGASPSSAFSPSSQQQNTSNTQATTTKTSSHPSTLDIYANANIQPTQSGSPPTFVNVPISHPPSYLNKGNYPTTNPSNNNEKNNSPSSGASGGKRTGSSSHTGEAPALPSNVVTASNALSAYAAPPKPAAVAEKKSPSIPRTTSSENQIQQQQQQQQEKETPKLGEFGAQASGAFLSQVYATANYTQMKNIQEQREREEYLQEVGGGDNVAHHDENIASSALGGGGDDATTTTMTRTNPNQQLPTSAASQYPQRLPGRGASADEQDIQTSAMMGLQHVSSGASNDASGSSASGGGGGSPTGLEQQQQQRLTVQTSNLGANPAYLDPIGIPSPAGDTKDVAFSSSSNDAIIEERLSHASVAVTDDHVGLLSQEPSIAIAAHAENRMTTPPALPHSPQLPRDIVCNMTDAMHDSGAGGFTSATGELPSPNRFETTMPSSNTSSPDRKKSPGKVIYTNPENNNNIYNTPNQNNNNNKQPTPPAGPVVPKIPLQGLSQPSSSAEQNKSPPISYQQQQQKDKLQRAMEAAFGGSGSQPSSSSQGSRHSSVGVIITQHDYGNNNNNMNTNNANLTQQQLLSVPVAVGGISGVHPPPSVSNAADAGSSSYSSPGPSSAFNSKFTETKPFATVTSASSGSGQQQQQQQNKTAQMLPGGQQQQQQQQQQNSNRSSRRGSSQIDANALQAIRVAHQGVAGTTGNTAAIQQQQQQGTAENPLDPMDNTMANMANIANEAQNIAISQQQQNASSSQLRQRSGSKPLSDTMIPVSSNSSATAAEKKAVIPLGGSSNQDQDTTQVPSEYSSQMMQQHQQDYSQQSQQQQQQDPYQHSSPGRLIRRLHESERQRLLLFREVQSLKEDLKETIETNTRLSGPASSIAAAAITASQKDQQRKLDQSAHFDPNRMNENVIVRVRSTDAAEGDGAQWSAEVDEEDQARIRAQQVMTELLRAMDARKAAETRLQHINSENQRLRDQAAVAHQREQHLHKMLEQYQEAFQSWRATWADKNSLEDEEAKNNSSSNVALGKSAGLSTVRVQILESRVEALTKENEKLRAETKVAEAKRKAQEDSDAARAALRGNGMANMLNLTSTKGNAVLRRRGADQDTDLLVRMFELQRQNESLQHTVNDMKLQRR